MHRSRAIAEAEARGGRFGCGVEGSEACGTLYTRQAEEREGPSPRALPHTHRCCSRSCCFLLLLSRSSVSLTRAGVTPALPFRLSSSLLLESRNPAAQSLL